MTFIIITNLLHLLLRFHAIPDNVVHQYLHPYLPRRTTPLGPSEAAERHATVPLPGSQWDQMMILLYALVVTN